jgi:hypothetical protein
MKMGNQLPKDRILKFDNNQVYIHTSKFKLSTKRKFIEMLCLLDVINHQKMNKSIFGPSFAVVISEEAAKDAFSIVHHLNSCSELKQALQIFPKNIRFTSNALKAYNPTSDFVYIQFL